MSDERFSDASCSNESCSCSASYSASGGGSVYDRLGLWLAAGGLYIFLLVLSSVTDFVAPVVWQFVWLVLYAVAGFPVIAAAARSLIRGGVLDEAFLMSIATIGAFFIGSFAEAAAVMVFYQIGEALQDRAAGRARAELASLASLRPDVALRLADDGGLVELAPSELVAGDVVVIKPGDRVPADGTVIEGSSDVSSLALTGESVPHAVDTGDSVMAGEVNITGLIKVRVDVPYSDSALSRMLSIVDEASQNKSRIERFFTRFARIYTPSVVILAALLAFVPPLLGLGSLSQWGYRALILLVISCPCALLVGIPSAYVAGIAVAAKRGIVIKGGTSIDSLASVSAVVFDKTGTLTHGEFELAGVFPENGFESGEVLAYAASAESYSPHPLAKAVVNAANNKLEGGNTAEEKKLTTETDDKKASLFYDYTKNSVSDVTQIPGRGISATVNGKNVLIGRDKLLHDKGIEHKNCLADAGILQVAIGKKHAGHIKLTDKVRAESAKVISELKKQGIASTIVLTGDSSDAASRALATLGVDSWHAELLPEEKVLKLEEILKTQGKNKVAFVGDGINDAAALARADVGIAMGAKGAEAAIESADCVIMSDSLDALPAAINIARSTRRIAWQNTIGVLAIKILFLSAGSLGLAHMWQAIIADVGVTVLAVLNSLRLFLKKN